MKNQYFGDINDYRKYGLLRCLSRHISLLVILPRENGHLQAAIVDEVCCSN